MTNTNDPTTQQRLLVQEHYAKAETLDWLTRQTGLSELRLNMLANSMGLQRRREVEAVDSIRYARMK